MLMLSHCYVHIAHVGCNGRMTSVSCDGCLGCVTTHDIVDTRFSSSDSSYPVDILQGWTALSYASYEGHVEVVSALLRAGAAINLQVPVRCRSAVTSAAVYHTHH
jgi:Ankyrin repeat